MKKIIKDNLGFLILVYLIKILTIVLIAGIAFIFREVLNLVANKNESVFYGAFLIFVIIYMAVFAVLYICGTILSQRFYNKCITQFRNEYMEKILHSNYERIKKNDTGYYTSLLTNDVNIIQSNFLYGIVELPMLFFQAVISLILLIVISWKIALITVFLMTLIAIIPAIVKKRMTIAQEGVSKSMALFTDKVKEIFLGISTIKTFNAEKTMEKSLKKMNNNIYNSLNKYYFYNNLSGASAIIISYCISLCVMIFAGSLSMKGKLDIGTLMTVNTLSSMFYSPIMGLASVIMLFVTSMPILKKFNVESAQISRVDKTLKIDDNKNNVGISINQLSFSYNDETDKILDNVSYNFNFPQKYLIIGTSGSGKSTLLKLIAGLYSSYTGSISINGYDRKDELNSKIQLSYIEQDPYIFTNTLAYNIALNEEYDEERLLDAIKNASLSEFVNKLPEGVNTIMDEECQQVSGGEKMRISLARALYSNANIMLFDEITASLDKKLTKNIDDYILKQQDQLIINIAHKYNRDTLHLYDKIIKISDGVLTEVTDVENL